MAYTKIVFQNSPSTATPLNAENLNHMDDQIALNDQRLTEIETSYVKSFNGRKGEVVPEDGDYDIGQISPLTGAQVGQVPVVTNIGTEEDPELVFRMGAGGSGHKILDAGGTEMTQEDKLQFTGNVTVTNDSANGKTVVNVTGGTSYSEGDGIDLTNDTISVDTTFTEASTRANIASGETFTTILGKIKKWFTDLPSMFVSKSGDTMSGPLQLGDSSARGELKILGNDKTHYGRFYNASDMALSDNRKYLLPDKSGTMALVEDFTPVNITSDYSVSGISTVFKVGKLVEVNIEKNISEVSHGTEIISKMPNPFGSNKYLNLGMSNGQSLPCVIEGVSGQNYGHLIAYYPTGSQTAARIDATITYFADV